MNGVSTRKVSQITLELCGTSFSKSTVSSLCEGLDPIVEEWNNRPLNEHTYPFVLVDAMYIKVRENGRVRSRAVLIATGVNEEGYREVLGIRVGNSESQDSWNKFFSWLKQRGLQGVDLVVSDQHSGLVSAIERQFQGCSWQRCQTHFIRNILDKAPKAIQDELLEDLRSILHSPTKEAARFLLEQTLTKWAEKAPEAM